MWYRGPGCVVQEPRLGGIGAQAMLYRSPGYVV